MVLDWLSFSEQIERCPYKFYETLTINFTKHRRAMSKTGTSGGEAGGVGGGVTAARELIETLHIEDPECAVRVKTAGSSVHTVGKVTLEVEAAIKANSKVRDMIGEENSLSLFSTVVCIQNKCRINFL